MSVKNNVSFLRLPLLAASAVFALIASQMVAAQDPMRDEAVAERIKPVGEIVLGPATTAEPVVAEPREPAKVYQDVCFACHGTGAAGAPKVGDSAAWAPRAATGIDSLVSSAINGKGAMPPRGGNPTVTDDELRGTIQLMLKETGLQAN